MALGGGVLQVDDIDVRLTGTLHDSQGETMTNLSIRRCEERAIFETRLPDFALFIFLSPVSILNCRCVCIVVAAAIRPPFAEDESPIVTAS